MSESESKESLTIARLSLYAAVLAVVLGALTLFADTPLFDRLFQSPKPPREVAQQVRDERPDAGGATPPVSPLPPTVAAHPLGEFAQLTENNVRNRTYEDGLNGFPYVVAAPTEGAWLGKICDGDVIVTVNGDAPPDELAGVGTAIAHASTIQVRPGDLWDSRTGGANVTVEPTSQRRC